MVNLKYFLSIIFVFISTLNGISQNILWGDSTNNEKTTSITDTGFSINLKIGNIDSKLIETEKGSFTQLTISGFAKNIDYGNPELPVYKELIELPQDANYKINIIHKKTKTIKLSDFGISNKIFPSQLSQPKIDNLKVKFQYNKSTYDNDTFYTNDLVKIIRLGSSRANTLARIEISPISYNPVQNTIQIVEELEVKITIFDYDKKALIEKKERFYSPYFNNVEQVLINKNTSENSTLKLAQNQTSFPLQYVIVADSIFKQSLQPFVQWKEQQGFKVIEAYTQNPLVGSTNTSIRNYLKNLYNSATASSPAPSYLLLVGDIEQLPSWKSKISNDYVTDLYYSEFTGDQFPEMLYGRFSATDTTELNNEINKTIEYEKLAMPSYSFLDTSLLVSGVDNYYAPKYGDPQVRYGTTNYFNSANETNCKSYLYSAGSGTKRLEIINAINNGVSVANYTAHGNADGWYNPAFKVSDVATMTNKGKYPFMIGNACLTNNFEIPVCFGEALLRAKDKGAIGYIGASSYTYWNEDLYWAIGFGSINNPTYDSTGLGLYDRMFHTHNEPASSWAISAAQYITAGNMAVTQGGSKSLDYWELYHLMGDPSLVPYLKIPTQINPTFSAIIEQGPSSVEVHSTPFSQVAISQNKKLIASTIADSNGIATLWFNSAQVLGQVDLVITGQNLIPYFGNIFFIVPTKPYIILDEWSVNDSLANINYRADNGENISLNIKLKNISQFNTKHLKAKLISNDSNITITDSIIQLDSILALDSISLNNVFGLKIAQNAVDKNLSKCSLILTDSANNIEWNSEILIPIYAPNIIFKSCNINDKIIGNGNNIIDAGETVKLNITIKNNGSNKSFNIINTLACANNLITINTNNILVDSLLPDSSAIISFEVTFDSQLKNHELINFLFNYVSQSNIGNKSFNQIIGKVNEDFETGDFSKFIWQSSNNNNWIIDSLNYFAGRYSARSSKSILDNESSGLYVNMTTLTDDSLSFYYKVSSEVSFDFLNFYIDGKKINMWSGNVDWKKFSIFIPEGYHSFLWEYSKDAGYSVGSDAAWIDNIKFPAADAWSFIDKNKSLIKNIKLYPNPTNDRINISFETNKKSKISTQIYNELGQLISSEKKYGISTKGENTLNIDVSSLKKGIYIIQINIDDEKNFKKFIVN